MECVRRIEGGAHADTLRDFGDKTTVIFANVHAAGTTLHRTAESFPIERLCARSRGKRGGNSVGNPVRIVVRLGGRGPLLLPALRQRAPL